jgi:membrane fusion protein (multidrug efflux system)
MNAEAPLSPETRLPSAAPPASGATATAAPAPNGARGLVWRLAAFILALALVFLVATRWNAWTGAAGVQSTDDAYLQADLTPLNARVAGYVKAVPVADYASVRAGEVVAELVDDDYRAQVAQAQAAVDSARAQIGTLEAQAELQEATLRSARATVRSARATLVQNRRDAARQRTLLQSGAGSTQSSERADTTSEQAAASLDQAQAQADVAERQLHVLAAQITQAKATLEGQEAALALARINLDRTRIVAPVSGVLGARQVRPGQFVAVGGQVNTLTPLPNVWVVANYKETQLAHVRVGQPATISIDTFPDVTFRGRVVGLAPASGSQFALLPPDNATGNFTKIVQRIAIKITLDDVGAFQGRLRPGMSVTARIDTRAEARVASR